MYPFENIIGERNSVLSPVINEKISQTSVFKAGKRPIPRLGKRELIRLLLFTCNYVVFVLRGFLFLWVLGMGYVILLWHSLSLPYNYFADRKDMKKLHDALKTIYGPKSSGATPLLSADGSTLLTDKDTILKRWAEHFNSVLNRPSSVNDNAINRLPQIECNVLLDEFPTVTETRKAIQHLSSGKAPGTDAIPAEVYKAGGLLMAEKLTELFQYMWRKEAIPQDFKDASIIHLYKRKGQPQRYLSLINCWEDTGKKFY